MSVIKDGTGTNLLTRVDSQNRLHTTSVDITENAHTSVHDEACFSLIGTTLITNVEKTVLILVNNPASNDTIALSLLRISLQGESGKPVTFKAYIGRSTYSSGGTVRVPVNVYVNSTVALDTSSYSDNPIIAGSDTQFQQAFLESTTTLDAELDGAVILPPNSSLRITVTGDVLASGTKTAFVRLLYYALDETLHQ